MRILPASPASTVAISRISCEIVPSFGRRIYAKNAISQKVRSLPAVLATKLNSVFSIAWRLLMIELLMSQKSVNTATIPIARSASLELYPASHGAIASESMMMRSPETVRSERILPDIFSVIALSC